MNRILVTGANGFIGRNALEPLCKRGYEVHAGYVGQALQQTAEVIWHDVDLLKSGAAARLIEEVCPTHLLHFAWYVAPGEFWTSPNNLDWVTASLSLLQAFAKYGGKRAVFAGTCAEYDWGNGYCSEIVTPLVPKTLYGVCKHSLSQILSSFGRQMDIETAWGRIFLLYGPHENHKRLVSSICRSLLRGEVAKCSHGHQIRDLLHVSDVADAFVALLDSKVCGEVNIASGQPISLRDVVLTIANEIGRTDLIEFGAINAPVDDPGTLVADVCRLHNEVGWKPYYDIQTGIRDTVEWWRQNLSEEYQ